MEKADRAGDVEHGCPQCQQGAGEEESEAGRYYAWVLAGKACIDIAKKADAAGSGSKDQTGL